MQNAAGEDKSFIQTIADDMLIGTNAVNPAGNFIVRTNGANRIIVNSLGNVGIGTATPSAPLHLEGGLSPSAMAINSDGSNNLIEFRGANVRQGLCQGFR